MIDKLIALVRLRKENRRNWFKDFVEPLNAEIEIAFADYLNFLYRLLTLCSPGNPTNFTSQDADSILRDRDQFRTLRLKVRTLAEEYRRDLDPEHESYSFFTKAMNLFAPVSVEKALSDPSRPGAYRLLTPMSQAYNAFERLNSFLGLMWAPYLQALSTQREIRQLIRISEDQWRDYTSCYASLRKQHLTTM